MSRSKSSRNVVPRARRVEGRSPGRSAAKGPSSDAIFTVLTQELSTGITAYTFTGSMVLGNRLTDVEHTIGEKIRQGSSKIVLDFTELDLIDSAGIGMLTVWLGSTEREGGKIAVAGATGRVKQLLEFAHLDRLLGMFPDLASAHSALVKA